VSRTGRRFGVLLVGGIGSGLLFHVVLHLNLRQRVALVV
jgi:hypothetical protein